VKQKTGLDSILLLLALVLLALSAAGAYELGIDHDEVANITLIQVPVYALAAALVILRPAIVIAHAERALVSILIVGFLMRLIIVVAPPASSDIYRYIWDGHVQAAGINPYRYVPADPALKDLRDETIYPLINRADYAPTIYPPMAQIIYVAVTRISETVTFMKLAMIAFEGLAVWAMLQLLRARGLPSSRVLLYLWHPLPLWAFAGDGHIDAAAIAFLLLAFVAVDRRSPWLAGAALASGVLVKYFPIVAGPALYKRWDWRLPIAFIATATVLYLPYLGVGTKVLGFLGGYVAEEGFSGGSGIFLWQLLASVIPLPSDAFAYYFPVAAVIMAVLALVLMLRARTEDADLAAAMILGVTFVVLVSPHYPWYFAWIIPFLAFYPVVGVVALTCAALYINLSDDWPPSVVDGLVIYGPAFALLAAEFFVRQYTKKETPRGSAVAA
jgi:alpha-1,6-mannosyltransferase